MFPRETSCATGIPGRSRASPATLTVEGPQVVKVNYRDGVAKALNPALDETLPPNPGAPSPGADVRGVSPVAVQMWAGCASVSMQMWKG